MAEERAQPPVSPTALGMQTGLDLPGFPVGLDPENVRGTLEEALVTPPRRRGENLGILPGQSGAEGLADLPNARENDPADGP